MGFAEGGGYPDRRQQSGPAALAGRGRCAGHRDGGGGDAAAAATDENPAAGDPAERAERVATRTTLEVNRALAAEYGAGAVAGVNWLDVGPVFTRGGALDRALFLDPLLQPPEPPLHRHPPRAGARMAGAIEPVLARLLGDRNHAAG